MTGSIFVRHHSGSFVETREQPYELESVLQQLLVDHPNVLAGDQMNSTAPRRWLLVAREMGISPDEDGATRWALDHLFLDQDGIPTLVEVKRGTDSRIRREVVGQMLDYAANAGTSWPIELLQQRFSATCRNRGLEPDEELTLFLGPEVEPAQFWQRVKMNLSTGQIRLVFVADIIPVPLLRIVEFLNEHMSPTEVLAVEVRRYVGEGTETYVPRVVGLTARTAEAKNPAPPKLTESEFLDDLAARCGPEAEAVVRRIMDWARDNYPRFEWRRGNSAHTFWPVLDYAERQYWPVGIRTDNKVEVILQYLNKRPPFTDRAVLESFISRLNAVQGVQIDASRTNGKPTFNLDVLQQDEAFQQFLSVLAWAHDAIRVSSSDEPMAGAG